MDRPLTLKSGVALQSNYSVQHRSDILMEEQIETVRTNQEAVKKALADLEKAKSEEDIDRCRQIVQDMREKSVKSVMALQVLHKVNTELMFARAELDAALEKQRGDINEARKRVMWLEDRMGVLCGKVRMRGQPVKKDRSRSYRSPDRSTFRSRLGSDGESSDDAFDPRSHGGKMGRNKSIDFKSDTTRRQQFSPSDSGSEYGSYQPQARAGMMDTPSSGAESYLAAQQSQRMRGPRMDDSDSESETATPQIPGMPQTMVSKTRSVSDSGSESDDEAETQKQMAEPKTPASGSEPGSEDRDQVKEDASESESDSDSDDESALKQPEPHQVIQIPSELGDQSESRDALSVKFEEGVTTSKPDKKPTEGLEGTDRIVTYAKTEDEQQTQTDEQTDEETGRERSDLSERTESGRSSVSAMSGESTLTGQQQEDKKAFMTEASIAKSVTIKTPHKDGKRRVTFRDKEGKRRVTFRDPTFLSDTGDKERTSIHHLFENDEDWARDYWYSEHHRFEYSEYSEVLCDMDPLSYHSMGLAVPGTFIEKSDMSFHDLPWRARRKGSEVTDIHKIALDKLASRVHSMYGKVFDAAMLSVQPTQTMGNKRETTMFSSFENSREAGARSITPTTDGRPGVVTAPPTTADATSRPQTVSTVVIPIKLKPGLNVYHPKPIPPPEMLPLTRTSKDKEYPRLADSFSLSEISKHKPAVRIVDQRNLHKETKLKLFKERPKEEDDGPSTTEKKFRMMLEREKSTMSRSSRSSRQTTSSSSSSRSSTGKREESPSSSWFSKMSRMGKGPPGTRLSMVRSLTKAERSESEAASTWSKIKPSSRGKEYGGLKWERVKTIVHVNLVSTRSEERKDAAKHLGILRCGDAMVFYALKERLRLDDDSRVRYEAAKSLILLGCWDEEVIQMILMYLVTGNTEIRQDLIKTMIDGKNVQYVNKKIQSFPELVKVLSHFCRNPDPDDTNAFDAAVLLGKFCVADENAKFKLLRSLDQSADTHIKAKALEVLTKQLSCTSWDVVKHLLVLFQESPVWKYRALAADLLIVLGRQHVCKKHEEERVYHILERKLWDDPTRDVRIAAAKALTALGMFGKACERIEKRLEDTDEDIRAQAVISVGTLEMKNEKIIRLLLEMLELDSSEYVRLMIARTFTILKMTDKRVLRALRERDKVEGPLARESRKALKVLESLVILPRLTTPGGQKSITSRATPQASPGNPPAVTV